MTFLAGALGAALAPVQQYYLLQARQMQALSFAVHIPLVCFGIAFPPMVLFVEWLYLRTGNQLYLTIARRWTRIMVALFAVGVITGTILSFEMGLLWPNFTATFGSVFGLGFAIEGFSFFLEAIFIGIYVYGWDRLSPRAHFAQRHAGRGSPGFTGSLMVIAVNAWMNHPVGFRCATARSVDVHPLARAVRQHLPVARARPHVHRGLHRHRLPGGRRRTRSGACAGAGAATSARRWLIPLTIAALASPVQVLVGDWAGATSRASQPIKLAAIEGLPHTERGAPVHMLGWYTRRPGQVRHRDPQAALAARLPRPERDGAGTRHGAPPTSARR